MAVSVTGITVSQTTLDRLRVAAGNWWGRNLSDSYLTVMCEAGVAKSLATRWGLA